MLIRALILAYIIFLVGGEIEGHAEGEAASQSDIAEAVDPSSSRNQESARLTTPALKEIVNTEAGETAPAPAVRPNPPEAPGAAPENADIALEPAPGVFTSPDTGTLYLSHDEAQQAWYLTERSSENRLTVYRLERERDQQTFRPAACSFVSTYRGGRLTVFGEGGRMYGSTDMGLSFRCNLPDHNITVLDKKNTPVDSNSSAESIELSILAREYARLWQQISSSQLNHDLTPVEKEKPTPPAGQAKFKSHKSDAIRPKSIERLRDIGKDDAEVLMAARNRFDSAAVKARKMDQTDNSE